MTKFDEQYRDLVFRAIVDGERVVDRTGVGTRKLFGETMRFNLQEEFPAPTLKKLFFESAKKEMFWIYQDQSNDVRLLREKYGVKVWDEWEQKDGTIGHAYGYIIEKHKQIDKLIQGLKENPHGRRHIISLWDIEELPYMSLQPCAFQTIWSVNRGKLNCQLVQRSGDLGLGVPFNTAQYAILVHMVAQCAGLEVGELLHTITDAHVYDNHVEPLKEMLFRPIMRDVKPQLHITNRTQNFYDFLPNDIRLLGYDSHPQIKLEVAV
ncbi:thymidylate synthase [Neobacillus rhizosphaerae]|uniref:thymidylate synthase n=1 Tax=Neobacillus rhizosphaerae TaxID=2880965 RepID=UPI003D2BFC05